MAEDNGAAATADAPKDTDQGAQLEPVTDQSQADSGDDDSGLSDSGKKALAAERRRAAVAEREAKTLKSQLQQLKDKDLSELERAKKDATDAAQRADAAESSALRLRVGLAAGVPAEHLHRLQGASEDELMADAKELVKLLKPSGPRPDPSQGSRATRPATQDMNELIRGALRR